MIVRTGVLAQETFLPGTSKILLLNSFGDGEVIDNFSENGKKYKGLAPSTQYFAFTFKVFSASLPPSPVVLGGTAAIQIILEKSGQ